MFNEENVKRNLQVLEDCETSVSRIKNMDPILKMAIGINDSSQDYYMAKKELRAVPFGNGGAGLKLRSDNFELAISRNGFSQMCESLGVPVNYIFKCLDARCDSFAAENLNTWLARGDGNKDKTHLLRTTDNVLHGFLSEKYGIMDDVEVLQTVDNVIGDSGNYIIKNALVSPEKMNLRIIEKDLFKIDGEDLSFGLSIRNSRVGRSILEVKVMIFKWICSNGIMFGGGFRKLYQQKHFNLKDVNFERDLSVALGKIPELKTRIKEMVESSIKIKLNDKIIQKVINDMEEEKFIPKPILKAVEFFDENRYGNSIFSVSQLITEEAQKYNVDLRERLEEYAGKLISLKGA